MFLSTAPHLSAPVLRLPNELLAEIAGYCTTYHRSADHAIDIQSIVALSVVSRRMRANAMPFLFKNIIITSERRLEALSKLPGHLLALAREINIFVDSDFFAALKTFAARPPSFASPYTALGKVLVQTPCLHALRILVAESMGERSPWTHSFLIRPDGIPVGAVLKPALAHVGKLRHLRSIQLDAFSDIAPLLRIAPNLECLSMRLPLGYVQYTNEEFVSALRYVPHLRQLAYSAESLRITQERNEAGGLFDDELASLGIRDESGSADLIAEIGKALPKLQLLDLQSRWYGDEILFPNFADCIVPEDLQAAISQLPSLKKLALPTTTISRKDYDVIRSNNLHAAQQALISSAVSEKATILRLGAVAQNLRNVSFVRPESASSPVDSAIEYDINVMPTRTLHIGDNIVPVVWPVRVEISGTASVRNAEFGQLDARPRIDINLPSHWGMIRQWQTTAFSYARENQMAAILAAGASGLLMGEAGRALYAHMHAQGVVALDL